MYRGTTPTLVFDVNIDLTQAKKIYVTFAQKSIENPEVIFEESDVVITPETVTVKLTQEQTLQLSAYRSLLMQIRAVLDDDTAVASNIMQSSVGQILKDGEI